MPRRDPFTAFCRQAAALASPRFADLHCHTTASDGDLTPSQVVAFARQAKVLAVAITDHDTVAGVADARRAAEGCGIDVVAGVELSASFRGREVHLLGYFVDTDHPELTSALHRVCVRRRERFRGYLANLSVRIPGYLVNAVETVTTSPGRRHVASLLVKCGAARTRSDAFRKYLDPIRDRITPKDLFPAAEAISLVKRAGGVTSLAHPPADGDAGYFAEWKTLGLDGVECVHPNASNRQTDFLRETARTLGLFVTGGTDSHGTDCPGRKVGDGGIGPEEWDAVRSAAGRA